MNDGTPSIVVLFDSARSADPPHKLGDDRCRARAQHLAARGTGGDILLRLEHGQRAPRRRPGARRARQRSKSAFFSGFAAAQASKSFCQAGVRLGTTVDGLAGVLDDLRRDDEGLLSGIG